jgi:hypothetical protein
MYKIIGVALFAAIVGYSAYFTKTSGATMLRLTGHGVSPSLNLDVNIAAIKTKAGKVEGQSVVPRNFKGKVVDISSADPVELTPPGAGRDYWCVNVSVKGSSEFSNWLWFIKDVEGGPDLLSFDAGHNLSCATAPAPVQPFEAISSGDFKTDIR